MCFAVAPEVEGHSVNQLPSTDEHLLKVIIHLDSFSFRHTFPLEEVPGDASIYHDLDSFYTSLPPGAHSLFLFDYILLANTLYSWNYFTFESFGHHHKLDFFFAVAQRIEARLEQGSVAVFLKG